MSGKAAPHVSQFGTIIGEKGTRAVLKDLEKVQKCQPPKQLMLAESLVFNIVFTLRKSFDDHLLQTTSIWVLINLLRIDIELVRKAMIDAGVPAVLYEIMSQVSLSGAARQYASELCHYLCSNDSYTLPDASPQGPIAAILAAGGVVRAPSTLGANPSGKFVPRDEMLDNGNPYLNDGMNLTAGSAALEGGSVGGSGGVDGGPSYNSDLSSSAASNGIKRYPRNYGKLTDKQLANMAPFVPYRVDEKNMQVMEGLFAYKALQPQRVIKSRGQSRGGGGKSKRNASGSNWQNGHDQNGRYAPTWDGVVAENSILTMDSNLEDGPSVDNSYYNVSSLFDGREQDSALNSYTRGMNDSVFSNSDTGEDDDNSITNGHGGRSIVDFDDNSTAYEGNNQLLSNSIVAAYHRADDYIVREKEMSQTHQQQQSLSHSQARGAPSRASVLKSNPLSVLNAKQSLTTPSQTPSKYDSKHYRVPQRGLYREQSNSFEQSYAQWDPQLVQPATNVYGGSTLSGGPGAIENPNENLSVNSWDGYDTIADGGSANVNLNKEMRQRARSQEEELLTPQYTASNRLFRTKNVLPSIDKYYDQSQQQLAPSSAPGGSPQPAGRLVFNNMGGDWNENMGTYSNQQRCLGLGSTRSVSQQYQQSERLLLGTAGSNSSRTNTVASGDFGSPSRTGTAFGGGIPTAGATRANTAEDMMLMSFDGSRVGTATSNGFGMVTVGATRAGTANSNYFLNNTTVGNGRQPTPSGAIVASAGAFVDYNQGFVGGIGGMGGGGSVVSMLSRQTMGMTYSQSDAGSVTGGGGSGDRRTGGVGIADKKGRGKRSRGGSRGGDSTGSIASIHTHVEQSEADMILAKLDPLSLNITAALRPKFSAYALSERVDGDDDDEWDFDDDDQTALTEDQSAALSQLEAQAQGRPNVLAYGERKRVRLRAEKLVDYSFTRKLFIQNKATLQDSQDLIHRMESILELLDTEHTGYVTWESFSRLILSLAPPHLLRADVMTFLNAQSCNSVDLVDYREFIISGKVMIISKEVDDPNKLPIQGWINRQAQITGEASTYTWKNHVQWYRGRKAQAMIWLMRYGQRAILLGDKMATAQRYLAEIGKKARAKTHLMSCGEKALYAEELRLMSMKAIVKRCIRARRFLTSKDEASRYLFYIGDSCKKFMAEKNNEDNLSKALERIMRKRKAALDAEAEFKKSRIHIGYANMFNLHQRYQRNFKQLCSLADFALTHSYNQDEAYWFLKGFADSVLAQIKKVEDAQIWLEERANKMLMWCANQDTYWLSLIRIGNKAYRYLCRQEDALAWLLEHARKMLLHRERQDQVEASLVAHGQKTLSFLNAREIAYAYMCMRKVNALSLLEKQVIALAYLRRIPKAFYAVADKKHAQFVALCKIGRKAMRHMDNHVEAFAHLRYIAGKAGTVLRRCQMAQVELRERGEFAKFFTFMQSWPFTSDGNKQRVAEEMERLTNSDEKYDKSVSDLPIENQWRTVLEDAYNLIYKIAAPAGNPDAEYAPKPILGRFAIRQLLLDGKIVAMKQHEFLEELNKIDHKSLGVVPFEELFHWFTRRAHILEGKSDIDFYESIEHDAGTGTGTGTDTGAGDTQMMSSLTTSFMSLFSGTNQQQGNDLGGDTAVTSTGAIAVMTDTANGAGGRIATVTPSSPSRPSSKQLFTRPVSKTSKRLAGAEKPRKIMKFKLSTLLSVRIRALMVLYKRFGLGDNGGGEEFDMEAFRAAYAKLKRKKKADNDTDIDLRVYDYDF